ncbi:MAG: TonB-dependent receptor SusC [Candidatus Ordinivivax streblomastigis]|uniref:TonB-dependent receptor SusC n=1 Tax=Candidatus Ordinivivax streblomastigis TaxID=2540710 RepID=A0A5M8NX19_9BACT|nr:MAG: TonB-dependent receptor SusC [Candidatus Ordinivivax streblomastigis]
MNKLKYILSMMLLCFSTIAFGQGESIIVTGNVYSELDGGLTGVSVLEVDKTDRAVSAASTDFSGNFSLQIKNPNNKLRITYVGFKTVNLSIGNQRKFNVELIENATLTEVVVTARKIHNDGTFPIPEREISGAIQRINAKEFAGLSVASIDDALQGRIAGLDIVGGGGNLGAGSTLRIRGTSSINSNSEPLIVVNDVPFESNIASFDFANANQEQFANLLNLNPDDIEEISVMKDGASAAIWGSRGANGVISIRTKKGTKGPTRVQYTYRFSGKQQPKGLKMLNGDDYTMLMKQAYFNPRQNEAAANVQEFNYDPTFADYENFNNNTDWVKALTQYGFSHDHNVTVSGGGDKANFRLSVGYMTEKGTVIKQNWDRITTRLMFEYKVSDRIRFTPEFALTYNNNHKNLADDVNDDGNTENLLSLAYRKMPNVSIYQQDASGNNTNMFYTIQQITKQTAGREVLNSSQQRLWNPVALAYLGLNDNKSLRIMPKFSLRYDMLDPNDRDAAMLRYNGYVSFDYDSQNDQRFLPREVVSRYDDDISSSIQSDDYLRKLNRAYSNEQEALSIYSDQNLTYSPKLGEAHSLLLYGSWQFMTSNSRQQELSRYGLASQLTPDPTVLGQDGDFKSNQGERKTMAFLGRVHYTYGGKYIVDASIRRDGDTRFGPNNRWGNFPAASLKWILSDEQFMQSTQSWLSEFGIRGSFGIVGTPPEYDYLYFSRYDGNWGGSNAYLDLPTIKPTSVQLSNLRWETSTSYNAGFDLSLFDFRYTVEFNVYKKRTEDLLLKNLSIPGSTGFGSLSYINAGVLDNSGWEIYVTTNKMIKTKDWQFDVNFNLSNNINQFTSLDPKFASAYNRDFNYDNGTYLSRIQEGNAIGSIYGFRYQGVYQYDKYKEGQEGTSPHARNAEGKVILDANGNPVPMYFAYGTTNSYIFRGGDAIYEDINHDGSIDELDIVYLGNSNPKLNGGFGGTLRYKQFSVNAFFNFRYGSKILNKARMNAENMYTNDNQSIAVNWRWRKDGDVTEMPRALYQSGYNWLASDRYVEDGSFLRFKYLTFAYNFDKKDLEKFRLNQLDFYLTLNNIWTWTKYTGVDPEISPNVNANSGMVGVSEDNSLTPRAQYFTLGVTVGF